MSLDYETTSQLTIGLNEDSTFEKTIRRIIKKDGRTQWKRITLVLVFINSLLAGGFVIAFIHGSVKTSKLMELAALNKELQVKLNITKANFSDLQIYYTEEKKENNRMVHQLQLEIDQVFQLKDALIIITPDCSKNISISGIYFARTNLLSKPVYCEVDSNNTPSWMVIQRRIDDSVDFDLKWIDYQEGFGYLKGNLWFGLDALHEITSSAPYELRVDLEDWENNTAYAFYSLFSVGNKASKYRLSISGYSGTAGNALSSHNNQPFSTKDRDNDKVRLTNCAQSFGAWWYSQCGNSNLNGVYWRNKVVFRSITWNSWQKNSLKRTVMKIRPK